MLLLHISPRDAPSRDAKLCTYWRWFARPDKVNTEPYHDLLLLVTKLRCSFHFVGAHSLPISFDWAGQAWDAQGTTIFVQMQICATHAIGYELHFLFDCPYFQGLRQQHAKISISLVP